MWAWQTALLLCSGVNRIISSHTLPPFHRLPEDRWCVCVWVCVFRPWLTWIMYFLISVSVNKTGASLPYEPHALENKKRSITVVLVCACAQVRLCSWGTELWKCGATWQKQVCEDIWRSLLFERLPRLKIFRNLKKEFGFRNSITSIEMFSIWNQHVFEFDSDIFENTL